MPASQLKRLKASLREQGITGRQQQSKKQKTAHKARSTSEKVERSAALQQIRDSFNPFELRQPSRPAKFATANAKSATNGRPGRYKDVLHRPGVTKGVGEDMRRSTLLPEMHRRNKIGGVVDRRIGEGDADMTPEEKAAQRFARAQMKRKGGNLFNLEASDDEDVAGGLLTHGGRSIADLDADDFRDAVSTHSDEDDGDLLLRKRRRSGEDDAGDTSPDAKEEDAGPERKKSRREVMEEVIAKSKYHKYERQKAKDDDDDLREELDKDMADVLALLNGRPSASKLKDEPSATTPAGEPHINPDRLKLLEGLDRVKADKEYDARLKQLAQDTRAQPSERTKTEEEKAAAEAERLRLLEANRLKRMQGDANSDDDEDDAKGTRNPDDEQRTLQDDDDDIVDEAAAFGFDTATSARDEKKLVLDDEDEFAIDEDLIASDSEDALTDDEYDGSGSEDGSDDEAQAIIDEEDEFVRGILGDAIPATSSNRTAISAQHRPDGVAFTYPCPRSHGELLEVVGALPISELPTVIQRIRALHHPSLSAANKEAMADFSAALVDHIAYMATQEVPLVATEQVIRHIHSLSRTYATEVATAFRKHLRAVHERRQPTPGDLIVLTAIGSIYPTSDHFHQVVTPAMTLIAKYLALTAPTSDQTHATGAYLVKLALNYQRLSKRYVPEVIHFTRRALLSTSESAGPYRAAHLTNLIAMAELWRDKTAFTQMFAPFTAILSSLGARKELQTLKILLASARQRCRPLQLHHHKPLPIRSSIPKFEEGFNPDKHYDPDKERSDARKLQKEYKRERKGAMRELRKDANFIAREQLREKKERDAAYEKKYKRLVAEIQGEEGHEAKEYEREKKARKRARR